MGEPSIKSSEVAQTELRKLEFVQPQTAQKSPGILRRAIPFLVMVAAGVGLYNPAKQAVINFLSYETTDDATVAGHLATISTKIGGVVERVSFEDHAVVKKGEILVQLDRREYLNNVKQLQADLSAATANYQSAKAELDRGEFDNVVHRRKNELDSQEALLRQARNDLERGEFDTIVKRARRDLEAQMALLGETKEMLRRIGELKRKGLVSDQEFESAKSGYDSNLGKVGSLQVQLKEAELSAQRAKDAAITKVQNLESIVRASQDQLKEAYRDSGSAHDTAQANYQATLAKVWSLQAQLEQAKLNLEYTDIRAQDNGTVSKRSVEPGMIIRPNQIVTLLLSSSEKWVIANFKETQLKNIYIGQPVEIEIDAIDGKTFEGTVQSISPGSGSTFALIPPDNATGNYTKIVQRVPVKINFKPESIKGYEDRLIPGISVYAKALIKSSK